MRAVSIVVSLIAILSVLIYGLGSALVPLLCAFALSYLMYPAIRILELKGVPRPVGILLVCLSGMAALVLVIWTVIPILFEDARQLLQETPRLAQNLALKIETIFASYDIQINLDKQQLTQWIRTHISEFGQGPAQIILKGMRGTVFGASKVFLGILNFLLIPVFFIFLMSDFEKIMHRLSDLVPPTWRPRLQRYITLANQALAGHVRGQLSVICVLSSLYTIGFLLVGLPYAPLLGLCTGLGALIPYAGPGIGITSALIVATAHHLPPLQIVATLVVFVMVQTLEGLVLTPRLVGKNVGLGPLGAILSLILGGNLLGIAGMIFALPIAGVCKVLLSDLVTEYKRLDLYQSKGEQ